MDDPDTTLNRRRMLELLGTASAVGLAGCSANDDDDGGTDEGGTVESGAEEGGGAVKQELGERVPTLDVQYWTGVGGLTEFMEDSLPTIEDNWIERLNLEVDVVGKDIATQFSETNGDQRTHDVAYWGYTTTPYRLDPNWPLARQRIDTAGGNGLQNGPNYASCDYSVPALEQETAVSEEERQELVNEAESVLSEDYALIPTGKRAAVGAARTDKLDLDSVGEFGIDNRNAFFILNSYPKERGRKKIGSILVHRIRSINPYVQTNPSARLLMNYSPLIVFNENAQLAPYLADDWSVEENGTVITFTLRDATFHNDEPITAEDVKWTYEFLESAVGELPGADFVEVVPFASIEAIDESTVEFTFDEPSLAFLAAVASQVGIVNSQHWIENGAEDSPGDFAPEPGYQSGPFKIDNFQEGEVQDMSTWPGHPEAPDPDDLGGVILQGFRDETSKLQAFRQGQVDWITDLGFGTANQIQNNVDEAEVASGLKGLPYHLNPQYPSPPTKFTEFRQALGMALNRQEIVDIAVPIEEQDLIYSARMLQSGHPWGPPDDVYTPFTTEPTGDPEGARQVLEEAGWGWDDNDNLRYPADVDLSPRWPAEEEPSAEDFPCLEMFD